MKTYFAVTGVIKNKGKVLILKKAPDDRNYPNRWSFCSGFVKEFESAEENVLREIKEETGLKGKIIKKGTLFENNDKRLGRNWIVLPFLCSVDSRNVKLCHENTDYKWIDYKDIKNYKTVPGLQKDLKILGLA
ncbi:hypothetical protein CMO83_01625 [Candidatus Woesearchaeota archaeon]|jgi:8-oxo-dGTP diphosphatase|nr:hypothetical protein [Candidatus Woesearchaeota archaeon]MDP6648010.1 NUDIX hydrolase [Candidatus Woesearchaeota archaeon]|tara:strand:- start:49464 stop:49862 length:399 start_codon:yes stop_codon:yes gene_type:complete